MTRLLTLVLVLTLAMPTLAQNLGNRQSEDKSDAHVLMNPGTPDGREGGETIETAIAISAIPFSDTGNTSDNTNDYDAECPYSDSTSPDVVYSFIPPADIFLNVDLFGSTYDTKTYIMDDQLNIIACNDDFYPDYVSFLEAAELYGGQEYFIVIDGWGGDSGDYVVNVTEFIPPEPCIIEPYGYYQEMEPPNGPGYVDEWNSGCNGEEENFFVIDGGGYCGPSEVDFFGKSGWDGEGTRDTDWYIVFPDYGGITWTVNAEQEIYAFVLGPQDCASVGVIEQMLISPCEPQTMIIQGGYWEPVWIWIGPSTYDPPPGFEGYEFDYHMHFDGLYDFSGVTATEEATFDKIKSMYR